MLHPDELAALYDYWLRQDPGSAVPLWHALDKEEVAPWLGLAVWAALACAAPVAAPNWKLVKPGLKGAVFLVALVLSASMVPVKGLPPPTALSTFALGGLSAFFDNIPLTALALKQGGYDWAMLAYAVGFGGSMLWFGSSAGVAITNLYPEGRSLARWLKEGWFVPVAYLVGFFVMLGLLGWNPTAENGSPWPRVAPAAATP